MLKPKLLSYSILIWKYLLIFFTRSLMYLLKTSENQMGYRSRTLASNGLLRGNSKMTSPGQGGGRVTKIRDKVWHRGGGRYMQIVTSPAKKMGIRFYFSLVFGQHGSSWAMVNIPVGMSFQALAWVLARRFRMPLTCTWILS